MSAGPFGLAVRRFGVGLAGAAGGVQGAGDLGFAQAGLAGGGGQLGQVGGRVGVQGAVGGPEQAGVAVALFLGGDPADQPGDPVVRERAGGGLLVLAFGFEQADGGVGSPGLRPGLVWRR
jgi:hypothetical protein